MTHPFLKPGVRFLIIAHDDWCPGANGDPEGCICKPDTLAVDREEFIRISTRDAETYKNAGREAAKALRRAAGGER